MASANAQAAQSALQAGQLGQAISQAPTHYCQTRDTTEQERFRHDQTLTGSDRQNEEQDLSARKQSDQTTQQSLKEILSQKGQFVGQLFH